jgi:hypothetical protein
MESTDNVEIQQREPPSLEKGLITAVSNLLGRTICVLIHVTSYEMQGREETKTQGPK